MAEGERESTVRRARIGEAALLSEITWRALAYWGYDAAFMTWAREAVRVQPEYLHPGSAFVLDEAAGVAGFYILRHEAPEIDLHYLMVEPHLIGTGRGKRLWLHAAATARERGATVLTITSDPNAERFYQAMGAVTVGQTGNPPPHMPDWRLRLMRFTIPVPGA
jgi:GNAT superfamily N-acetyltransferase